MATGLTKTALIRLLAEKLELTNKQVAAFLDLLAETASRSSEFFFGRSLALVRAQLDSILATDRRVERQLPAVIAAAGELGVGT